MKVYTGLVAVLFCAIASSGWAENGMSPEAMDKLRSDAFELYSSGDEYADQDRALAIMNTLAEHGDPLAKLWVDPTWHPPRSSEVQRTMRTRPYSPLRDEQIAKMNAMSEAGNAQAQYMMALAYSTLRAEPPNKSEIIRLLELSAEQGFPLAMQLLGQTHYQNIKSREEKISHCH